VLLKGTTTEILTGESYKEGLMKIVKGRMI
jgi:hypothetical protein